MKMPGQIRAMSASVEVVDIASNVIACLDGPKAVFSLLRAFGNFSARQRSHALEHHWRYSEEGGLRSGAIDSGQSPPLRQNIHCPTGRNREPRWAILLQKRADLKVRLSMLRGLCLLAVIGALLSVSMGRAVADRHADAWADRNAAGAALVKGKNREAVRLATRAIESGELSDVEIALTLTTRLEAYFRLNAEKAWRADAKRTIALCTKKIAQRRVGKVTLSRLYNARAVANKFLGDHAEALADYTAAIDARPNYAWWLFNRGQLYLEFRRYDLALADVKKILELKQALPASRDARVTALAERGRIKMYLGDYDGAIVDYDKALAKGGGGEGWIFLRDRGHVRFLMGDYRGAIRDYKASISRRPSAFTRGRLARARAALRKTAKSPEADVESLWDDLLANPDRQTNKQSGSGQ